LILKELKRLGVTHAVGLPDNIAAALFQGLEEDPDIQVIPVTREGEAFAIAAGLYVGGKHPLVIVQCTGFYESGDAIRGTVWGMKVPILLFIGYRGYKTLAPGSPWVDSAARFLEPTLRAWEIPYEFLGSDEDLPKIEAALDLARERSRPVALLLTEACIG